MVCKSKKLVDTFENADILQSYQDKIDNNFNLKFNDISDNINNIDNIDI